VPPRHRARIAGSGRTLADPLRLAHTHWTRLRGLIGTGGLGAGEGLWIRPCRQVHMFWMTYPIDVAFLDDEHRVLRVVGGLRPWRVSQKVPGASSVIELASGGAAAAGLREGDRLVIEPV
jgi:hypothetical protein